MDEKRTNFYIYFAALSVSLAAFVTGNCFVWTSPFISRFQSSDPAINPVGAPVSISELAWIVAGMPFGMLFGPPASIICVRFFTKKTTIMISLVPAIVAYIICTIAAQPLIFILARVLMGLATGWLWSVLGTYIAEISEDRIRGLLGSLPGIMSSAGMMFVYVFGPQLTMFWYSIILFVPLVLFYVTFAFFVPNSPYDLVMVKNYEQAKESLKTLRGKENVEKEFEFIKEIVESKSNTDVKLSSFIKESGLRKALIIGIATMLCQQLSGIVAVLNYAENIFELAGGLIPPSLSAILLAVVAIMANVVSTFLVDKMGRKIMIVGSCIIEAISLCALGIYFYLLESGMDVSAFSWIPITSLLLFLMAFNLALASVPWIILGELFHTSVKAVASTTISWSNFFAGFVITLSFPYMVNSLGMGITFWVFSMIMAVGAMFCAVVLFETKGKNFQEIQKILNG